MQKRCKTESCVEVVPGHAEGLPPADANGKSDPFVSVQLVGKQFSRRLSDFVLYTQTTFAFEELTLKRGGQPMKIEVSLGPRYLGTHNIWYMYTERERERENYIVMEFVEFILLGPFTDLHWQRRSTTTIKSRTLEPVWNETLTDKHRYDSWLHREWHSGWSWIQTDASGSNRHRWRFL